jgi:hypothetical protein
MNNFLYVYQQYLENLFGIGEVGVEILGTGTIDSLCTPQVLQYRI